MHTVAGWMHGVAGRTHTATGVDAWGCRLNAWGCRRRCVGLQPAHLGLVTQLVLRRGAAKHEGVRSRRGHVDAQRLQGASMSELRVWRGCVAAGRQSAPVGPHAAKPAPRSAPRSSPVPQRQGCRAALRAPGRSATSAALEQRSACSGRSSASEPGGSAMPARAGGCPTLRAMAA